MLSGLPEDAAGLLLRVASHTDGKLLLRPSQVQGGVYERGVVGLEHLRCSTGQQPLQQPG